MTTSTDYDKYTDISPSDVQYSVKIGLPYGGMPDDALVSKFEQTDDGDVEYGYDDFVRREIKDRRPDAPTFESEEPRKSLSNKGYLNLIHSNNRGGSEPRHSEMFLEDTWGDPRGIATDPDYKELRRQHEARTRFVRWSADADNSVPSGRWSEGELMRKKQQVLRQLRPRLMWFTTSKDGRRLGETPVYNNRPVVSKIDKTIQAYGDIVQAYAENPQRATTIMSNTIIARSKMYQQNTTDHEFTVAHYGEDARRRKLSNTMQQLKYTDLDGYMPDCDKTANYKAMGIIMSQIVKNRHETAQDIDYGKADATQVRKTVEMSADLAKILQAIAVDSEFANSAHTVSSKTATPQQARPAQYTTTTDGSIPASHLLNAQAIYKSVKEGGDLRAVSGMIATDDTKVDTNDKTTLVGKSMGATDAHVRLGSSHIEVDGVSMSAHVYKGKGADIESKIGMVNPEYVWSEADDAHTRKSQTATHTNPDVDDTEQQIRFNDNTQKERMVGVMGSKYTRREMDRDSGMTQGSVGDT